MTWIFIGLLGVCVVLLVAATVTFQLALRATESDVSESRDALSQRLQITAFVLALADLVIAAPAVGLAFVAVAVAWTLWWLPASHRVAKVDARAVFRVPPSAVAAVMFDVSQRPRWVGAVAAATLETPGLLREGSVIRQTVRMAGRQFNVRVRVADLDPGRKLVTTALLRVPQSEDVLEVAPHETGTLVTYSGAHQISLVYAILAGWRLPWMLKRLRAQRLADFERLQPLVERLGPSALAGSRP